MSNYEYQKQWRINNQEKYKEYQIKYRENNRDKFNESQKAWGKNNPEKFILIKTKTRAKKNGTELNIDINDIHIPEKCPILNIPIIREFRGGGNKNKGPRSTSPSIDRLDNTKGYVKGNIQIISHKANVMKSSASPEELLQFAYWVILTYGHLIDKEIS
jgi:hypothetical protein